MKRALAITIVAALVPALTLAGGKAGLSGRPMNPSTRRIMARPVVPDAADMVSHVWLDGAVLKDTKSRTWSETGTVPRVAKAVPRPAGLGPFSTLNYLATASAGVTDVGSTDSLTIAALVAVGATPAATEYLVVSKATTAAAAAGVSMELGTTGTRLLCRAADGVSNTGPTSLAASLAPGGLYFLACTYTRSGGNITAQPYVNGSANGAGSGAVALGSITGTTNTRVGISNSTTGPFSGTAYELAVWKRALSPAEIAALHASLVAAGLF